MSASRQWRPGGTRLRASGPPSARGLAAVAVLAALSALLAGGPLVPRASAAPLASCTPRHGTIVAVDFAHWGGPILRGCGLGRRSGYALLHAAGFTTSGDAHDGNAIICRLGDAAFRHGTQYPTPRQQNCVNTPPASAYWAYWVAPRGSDHWTYSQLGVLGDVTKPGEVELWIFGGTNLAGTRGSAVPTFSPAALRSPARTRMPHRRAGGAPAGGHASPTTRVSRSTTATRTTTTTTTTHTTTSAAGARATSRAGAPPHRRRRRSPRGRRPLHGRRGRTASRPRRPGRQHPAQRRALRHRTHRTMTTTRRTSTARAGGTPVLAAQPTRRRASTGSATPLIISGALVLLLGAGAARAIWLRRHQE
jgi:hypothetical protein